MRCLAIGFSLLLLVGCATQAETRFSDMIKSLELSSEINDKCLEPLGKFDEFVRLNQNYITGDIISDDNVKEKTLIEEYASEQDVEDIAVIRTGLQKCIEAEISNFYNVDSRLADVVVDYHKHNDDVLVELTNKNIKIGEFNKNRIKIESDFEKNLANASADIIDELNRSHAEEIQRRQDNWRAFAKILQATLIIASQAAAAYTAPTMYYASPTAGNTFQSGTYLGNLSANPYAANSTSNPYGAGSPYGGGINNPYSQYGSPYSNKSVRNPNAVDAPKLYDSQGNYRGRLSSNPYDPESVSNPYGRYGSPYSADSIKNPYGAGSPYSPDSPNNPYGQGLKIIGQ